MPTYVTLFTHTQDGKKGIDQIPDVYEEARDQSRAMGMDIQDIYYGSVGEYDGFVIFDAPDGDTAETFRLAFEREGTHDLETYEIFEAEEYFQMIETTTP